MKKLVSKIMVLLTFIFLVLLFFFFAPPQKSFATISGIDIWQCGYPYYPYTTEYCNIGDKGLYTYSSIASGSVSCASIWSWIACFVQGNPGTCYTGSGGICMSSTCGTSSCGCAGLNPWAKYDPTCTATAHVSGYFHTVSCNAGWAYSTSACSTADKCVSNTNTYLNAGSCSCAAGGVYKTCCSGTSTRTCQYYYGSSNDGIPPTEGVCPAGTTVVGCGRAGQPACGQAACDTLCTPVNGGWSGWSGWSNAAGYSDGGGGTCSVACGTGTQTQTRTCTNPAPNSCGAACSGNASQSQNCNTQSCAINGACGATHYNCTSPGGLAWAGSELVDQWSWVCAGSNGGANSPVCQEMKPHVTISGQVYIDYAGNGTVGPGVSGVTVSDGVTSTTTAADGTYTISDVTPGNYTMTISNYGGTSYNITYPSPYAPTVYATNPSNTQNFGIQPPAPTCTMTANPTYVQTGKTAALTASYSLANGVAGTPTYTWYPDTLGAIITGASINTGTKKITATWNAPLPPLYQQSTAYPSMQICNPNSGLCGSCGMNVGTPSPPAPPPGTCTINVDCPITIIPTFTASGNVFIDNDKNRKISAGDQGFANKNNIVSICQIQGGNCNAYETLTTDTNGNFTSVGTLPLIPGQYTATLNPAGVIPPYQATTPTSIIFTVGNASTGTPCTVPANTAADCTPDGSGNVENLNFGISDSFPWMQAIGGDITGNAISDPNGGGFTDNIPTTANIAAGICSANGAFAMINGAGGTHGLINTGSKDATFGNGQEAAAQSWLAGGSTLNYPYIYNMPLSKEAKTSYANLSYLVNQSNLLNSNLDTRAGCGVPSIDCKLPSDSQLFPSYIYTVDGDLNLNSSSGDYTFPDGKYVILVGKDLNINTKIHVNPGSFVLFSVAGNINVAATVGENTASLLASDLEGYYSTDKSFNVLSNDSTGQAANCAATPVPAPDLRLNVAGSIVVNASTINGGSFNYATRDLCALDKQCPVFTITERPDFILNAPNYLMFPRRTWQEVAP